MRATPFDPDPSAAAAGAIEPAGVELAAVAAALEPDAAAADPARDGAGRPSSLRIASAVGDAGAPLHRGWAQVGQHHRWMEPFVLALLANGSGHGYAIVGELAGLGITNGPVDVGQVYRTLRDLERAGQVRSSWTTGSGAARRDYELTRTGWDALDEWAAVMKERARLVAEFEALYLQWVAMPRPAAAGDESPVP